jgi:galactose-1-phosphate uridylyltransferase
MAREYIKRYEKEIRPRIKLYKFENLPEDVQEKVINDEIKFKEDIIIEDLQEYSDYQMIDLPDKIYDKISEIIDEAKEETLASMKSYYENSTDPDYVKKDLIEEGHLYTIKGEFKE